jgi:hypothetical protein
VARVELDIDTDVPADRIRAALIDFTERRPSLWPGLNRKEYVVYRVGDTWAVVREGNGGPVWARERYDWSRPNNVTWTVEESGFCQPGSYVSADLTPRGEGTRVHVTWERHPKGVLGAIMVMIIPLMRGAPVRRSLQAGLDRIAQSPGTSEGEEPRA